MKEEYTIIVDYDEGWFNALRTQLIDATASDEDCSLSIRELFGKYIEGTLIGESNEDNLGVSFNLVKP